LIILADGGIRCLGSLDKVVPANIRRYMMRVVEKIKAFRGGMGGLTGDSGEKGYPGYYGRVRAL